ncbi:hypothetical protein GCM10009584_23510 [Ornithinimicrobium humiphilum]|nr:VWA domain-containing protein [Ornithinimicrobium humiphilum]
MRHTRLAALATSAALLLAPGVVAASAAPAEQAEDAELLLMLDASFSMADPDAQGEPKIDSARAALHEMIDGLDPSQSVGLRVFGGGVDRSQPKEAKCSDSELVVPIGAGNASALSDAVDDYAPLGETPIAYALQQAAGDLSDSGDRTIVLVSDGLATCDPDPCEIARQLRADGLDLVVHTVGLGADDRTRSQLQCIAAAGGGDYFDATDSETLTTALVRLSTRAFRPFVYDGTPVVGTPQPQGAPELTPGSWTDTIAEQENAPKHYAVTRSEPGSRLFVGATMKNPTPGGVSGVQVELETPDGTSCGRGTMPVFSPGGQTSFGSIGLATATDRSPACAEADALVLSLQAGSGSQQILGQPVEIVVDEVAPVSNGDELPGPADKPQWSGPSAGEPSAEVIGGVSPSAATPVEAGSTVSFDLVPGEIAFFSVPVDYGQRLEALVEFPGVDGPLAAEMRPTSNIIDMAIVAPNRAQVHGLSVPGAPSTRVSLDGEKASQAAAAMPEVRWANDGTKASALGGDHVVMVSLTSSRERMTPIPLTLTTDVVGEVSGVPEHAAPEDDASQTTAPADDAETTAPADEAEEPPVADGPADEDGGSSWLPWALAAGGVLVAGAGAVLLGRRRGGAEG